MAWLDFLKSIRLDNEETRKRREQGGLLNNIRVMADSNLDKIEPTVNKLADNGIVKYGVENAKNNVGVAAGLLRETTVRPITKLLMTQRDSNADNSAEIKTYQELLKIPEDQREEEAKNADTSRGFILSRLKEKYGSIDDASLQKKIDEFTSEQNDPNRGVFKIKDDKLNRAIFGNEDIHSLQSDQKIGEAKTGVPALGVAYAATLGALDSPLGGPSKGATPIAKGGIKKLAAANADDAVKEILKTTTKFGDNIINELAPRLSKLTDEKQIKSVVDTADKVIKENIDKAKPIVKDYASFLKSYDDGAKGGVLQKVDDGTYSGAYTRTTDHSKFYSDYYKEKGRAPSKKAWEEEAARQLESGKAESAFQDEFVSAGAKMNATDVLDAQDAVRELAGTGDITNAKRLNDSLDKYKLPEKSFTNIAKTAPAQQTPIEKTADNVPEAAVPTTRAGQAATQVETTIENMSDKELGLEQGRISMGEDFSKEANDRLQAIRREMQKRIYIKNNPDAKTTGNSYSQNISPVMKPVILNDSGKPIANKAASSADNVNLGPLDDAANRAAENQKVIDAEKVAQGNEAMASLGAKQAPDQIGSMVQAATPAASTPAQPITNVSQLSKVAKNSFENDPNGLKPNGIERAGGFVENGSAPPVKYRVLDDGSVFIEDGSHRLEYARQNGIEDFPMEDVSSLYKPAAQTQNPIDELVQAAAPVTDDTGQAIVDGAKTGGDSTPPTGAATSGDPEKEILDLIKTGKEVDKMGKKSFKDKFYQQFFDKLDPIKRMEDAITKKTGVELKGDDSPYALMRLYASMPQKISMKTKELIGTLDASKKAGATLDDIRVLGLSRRVEGRPDKSFAISQAQASGAIKQLQDRLGPEKFAVLNKTVDDIVAYNDSLIEMLVDTGVMSRKAVDAMHKANPDYFAKMQSVTKLLEKGDAAFRNGRTFNLSKQQVVKELKGMEQGSEILDPIESIVRSTELTMRTAHRNRVFKAMQNLSEIDPEMVVKIADPLDTAMKISLNMKNAEMRPVRDKLLRTSKTRAKSIKRLQSEINKLNKKGLHISLKTGEGSGTTVDNVPFPVEGLGGRAATKNKRNGHKLGPGDTAKFVRSLIEGPNKDLVKIKKMIGNRDPKLASLMDEFIGIKAEYEDAAGAIRSNIDKVKELADAEVPDGYKVIQGFGEGYKGRLAIPEELADVYAGLTQKEMDLMTGFMGSINNVMKTAVTTLNPAFAFIRNPIRDFKGMATNSQNIPPKFTAITKAWIGGLAEAANQGPAYQLWVKSGGGGGLLEANVDSTNLAKKLTKELTPRKTVIETVKSPKELAKAITLALPRAIGKGIRGVQKAGSVLENAPRIAEFQAAIKNGWTPEEAALASRNVTVDFHQSGNVGQIMNHWVPFLNARLQGNKKLYEAAKRNPKRFMKMYTGLTAAPILATAALNARYPEVMAQIDEQTKDNNFVIILGDGQNEKGDFTQVLKIPKGDIDKILGNPLENFVNFAMDKDPKAFGEVFLSSLSAAGPIDFVKDGKVNVSRAFGASLPVALKLPAEAATNHNFYYDTQIVPDSMNNLPPSLQKRDSTGKIDQFLGAMVGASPLKAEAARKSVTGSMFSAAPTEGLSNALVGASNNRPVNEFYSVHGSLTKTKNQANADINEAIATGDMKTAKALASDYNSKMIQDLIPWYKRYGQYLSEEDKQTLSAKIDGLMINLSKQSVNRRTESIASKRAKALQ